MPTPLPTASIRLITTQAIRAALNHSWEEAVEYNLAILESNPDDTDALNRLARAYTELGQVKSAKDLYRQVLSLDRYNSIARKNLEKLKASSAPPPASPSTTAPPKLFLEEPGKTKSVHLVKIADTKIINSLSPGTEVRLVPKTRTVIVTTLTNTHYLGCLPDDLSYHLIKLLRTGNKYTAIIKTTTKNSLGILIRETFRTKHFLGPSFPTFHSNTFNQ